MQLLRAVADQWPQARICVLVDGDPHGLSILSVYQNGSKNNRHSAEYAGLALGERAEWIGVRLSEIMGSVSTKARLTDGRSSDSLIPLTDGDAKKVSFNSCRLIADIQAIAMSRTPDFPASWRKELSYMVMYDRKAEIEALCDGPTSELSQILDNAPQYTSTSALVEYILARI